MEPSSLSSSNKKSSLDSRYSYQKKATIAITSLIVLIVFIFILVFAVSWEYLNRPVAQGLEKPFILSKGRTLRTFANDLVEQGYVSVAWPLIFYGQAIGADKTLKSGEYILSGLTPRQILARIIAGQTYKRQFTIIPGWTFHDLARALKNAEGIKNRIAGMAKNEIRQRLKIEEDYLEGIFFPDTYYYTHGMTDLQILASAHKKMHEILSKYWEKRDSNLPLNFASEVLNLASIIEKETGLEQDRPLISSVLYNRLRVDMMLQVDATVIFGLGESFDGDLTRQHLRQKGPYNTYLNKGLPRTPISFPSESSILAAIKPAKSDYLYFVARGDGSSQFSKILHEHNVAVRRYQRF